MSTILDAPQVAVSLGIVSGVPLSPILENPGAAEATSLANAADRTILPDTEHEKAETPGPRKPRTRGRGQQRRTSLEVTTGLMNVPRPSTSMRLPSTIKEEGVVKVEAAKARKNDGDAAKSQQDDRVAVETDHGIKGVKDENTAKVSSANRKRANKNTKISKQTSPSDQSSTAGDAENVSTAEKSTSKRRRYTRKSKPKVKGEKDEDAVERAGTAFGRAVAEVVENARGVPAADGGRKGDAAAGGHPSAGGDAGAAGAVGRPRAEGGEAGRGSAMAGGQEEDAGTKAPVDSEGAVEAVARRVESAVDAHTSVKPAPTEATTVTPEVAAGTAEAGAGSIGVDAARTSVDGRPVEVDTEAKVKSKSKPRPRRNNRKGGKSKKRSGTEEAEAVAGTKVAPMEADGGAPVEAEGGASTVGGGEVSAVGSEGAPATAEEGQQAQTREDSLRSGGEQADRAPADADMALEAAQGKKSGTRRRFWKGRAKRGGRQAEKKVAGEPADGGPAPAEEGKAASVDSGAAPSADPTATALDARTAALAHDGATDSVRGPSVDASKLSRSGTPSGKSQARRRRRTPARGGRARGGRAHEKVPTDAVAESAGAHDTDTLAEPTVTAGSAGNGPAVGLVAAYSVSGTNDAFVVTRTVDIGADAPVPVVLLAVT